MTTMKQKLACTILPILLTLYRVKANGGDYNRTLDRGRVGNPGLRLKINQPAFDYAATLAKQLIGQQLPNIRLPSITQSVQALNGYLHVYDLCISGFKSPAQTRIYPSGPNRINIDVTDMDISVNGQIQGQATVLLPMQISGRVAVTVYGAGARISLAVQRGADGAPSLCMVSCSITVRQIHFTVHNGDALSSMANSPQIKNRLFGVSSSSSSVNMVWDMVVGGNLNHAEVYFSVEMICPWKRCCTYMLYRKHKKEKCIP